jgi:hypothetical protein
MAPAGGRCYSNLRVVSCRGKAVKGGRHVSASSASVLLNTVTHTSQDSREEGALVLCVYVRFSFRKGKSTGVQAGPITEEALSECL